MTSSAPHLNLVVLRSSDLERAARFYEAIGLDFTRHKHGSGPEHCSTEIGGLVFELYPASAKSPSSSGTRIGFRVPVVDNMVSALVEQGAELISAPADSEWGRRAVLRDLDGHLLELTS